jgi:hypothetical protein
MEENEVKQFQCKEGIQIVEKGKPVTFNGAEIRLENGVYIMSTHEKCRDVDADVTIKTFIHFRALAAYIALWSRPELLGGIQLLAPRASSPSTSAIKELKSIWTELKTKDDELRFKPLDLQSLRVVCYSDAGFASHEDDFRSQLGYVIAIVDKHDQANIVAFASRKCRRVTRSVLASELLALVEGYDAASAIDTQLTEILGVYIPVWSVVDSRTLLNVVTRLGNVTEKRLMVDAADLRDEYLSKRMFLFWATSGENCADPFTKKKASFSALEVLLAGKLSLRPNASIEHIKERNADADDEVMPLI